MRLMHAAEGSANVGDRGTELPGERRHGWHITCAHYLIVDVEAENGIIKHGPNLIRI
ncbi:MAG: hypothetical protein PVS2B2_04290 [Candidatus Acidiferrum sp.]